MGRGTLSCLATCLMSRGKGRNRGNDGIGEGSLIGWATPAATRLRFKTESRGDSLATTFRLVGSGPALTRE